MAERHLVVGAGPVGRHVASLLIARGDHVVIGSRSGGARGVAGAEGLVLDATDADAVSRAADGASAIFHTANPGPYPVWPTAWPRMSTALLAAA